ncbi:Ca2+-binding protein, RTX toxin-related [Gemmobacter aquatilis]|uniref:Ca2+-binding protein, RTX toxin-related n=1 Tax=Gemmobacter aquatilis TaxID=933059 RepID=A0A1H8B602_9RHOB|nr:Hint domain-containing protein [Gemmobacter aquatilis]SEM78420.1 Ca2+-binding protein, RTX toxin-related [Gemmobacter aquatilis]
MATTFNWIYLGTSTTSMDRFEGNATSDNAAAFNGQTFGSSASPLFSKITSATMIDNGGTASALDTNNNASNDQFTTNIGAGTQTFTYDGNAAYNATITYADGTTATVTAVVAQTTTGELFLSPELTANTDTTAYEAKPILSITLNSVSSATNVNFATDRYFTAFDDGYIDGTSGGDLINGSYVEPAANGSDKVDNTDAGLAGSSGNDDYIRAGAGNDTVMSGLGNDSVYAGIGNDSVDGGDGNDTLYGEDGDDTLLGAAGNDQIRGGIGNDSLYGAADADTLYGDDGSDHLFGGTGADQLFGGTGDDTLQGGDGADILNAGSGMDYADYSDSGSGVSIDLNTGLGGGGTAAGDTLSGVDGIIGSGYNDTLLGFDGQGSGADTYTNIFYGAAGNDSLDGRGGDDALYGGADHDTVLGGDGADSVYGDAGNDSVDGGAGNDQVYGGDGDDIVNGGIGADSLYGGAGNDTLSGGDGADLLDGGDDRDVFANLTVGDTIVGGGTGDDHDELDLTSWGKDHTNIIFDPDNPENGTVEFLDDFGNVIGTMTFTDIEQVVPCFTAGTKILCEDGDVLVEDLIPGKAVLTRDNGWQVIRWLGRRRIAEADLLVQPNFRPVLISKGALGDGLPERDMMVSPQHRMLVTGTRAEMLFGEHEVLVAALHLVGMEGITRASPPGVTYFHLLFDKHEIIRADGCWTESFQPGDLTLAGMDDAQRNEILLLFPDLQAPGGRYMAARRSLRAHEARVLLHS